MKTHCAQCGQVMPVPKPTVKVGDVIRLHTETTKPFMDAIVVSIEGGKARLARPHAWAGEYTRNGLFSVEYLDYEVGVLEQVIKDGSMKWLEHREAR